MIRSAWVIWPTFSVVRGKRYARWAFTHPQTRKRVVRSSRKAAEVERRRLHQLAQAGEVTLTALAASEYADCHELALKRFPSLRDAVAYADRKRGEEQALELSLGDTGLKALVDQFIAFREKEGSGPRHLRDLKQRLERFAGTVGGVARELTVEKVNAWLTDIAGSPRSRLNYRRAVANFLRWVGPRLRIDSSALFKPKLPKGRREKLHLFTPSVMTRLLASASKSILPLIAIGGFAGLRQSEILKLDWSDIHWRDRRGNGFIVVPERTKTGRRIVPLVDNLRAWLEPLKATGPVIGISEHGVSKAFKRTVDKANRRGEPIAWAHNGLRHSFASYRCALTHNEAQVAEEMGHSVAQMRKDYKGAVTEDAAEEWFGIRPASRSLSQ